MKNIFDLYTRKYDNWFNNHSHTYLTELLALKKEIPNRNKGIEIGVGSARFAQTLNIHYGVDLSKKMLKIAKDRGCKVSLADAENLPFRTNEFDYALLMVTLCFVENPRNVIREANRIINKDGKLIIGIIDKHSKLGKFYRKKKSIFYKYASFFSTDEVIRLLKLNKFRNIKTYQTLVENPSSVRTIDEIEDEYGKGGFVVITAIK